MGIRLVELLDVSLNEVSKTHLVADQIIGIGLHVLQCEIDLVLSGLELIVELRNDTALLLNRRHKLSNRIKVLVLLVFVLCLCELARLAEGIKCRLEFCVVGNVSLV